jgi:hypothetical protein
VQPVNEFLEYFSEWFGLGFWLLCKLLKKLIGNESENE